MVKTESQPGSLERGTRIGRDFNILAVGAGILALAGVKALELSAGTQAAVLAWIGINVAQVLGFEWLRRRQERKRLGLGEIASKTAVQKPETVRPTPTLTPKYSLAA